MLLSFPEGQNFRRDALLYSSTDWEHIPHEIDCGCWLGNGGRVVAGFMHHGAMVDLALPHRL